MLNATAAAFAFRICR